MQSTHSSLNRFLAASFVALIGCGGGDTTDDNERIVKCGTFCIPASVVCVVGVWNCEQDVPVCEPLVNAAVGTACGTGGMCDGAGRCLDAADAAVARDASTTADAEPSVAPDAGVDASSDDAAVDAASDSAVVVPADAGADAPEELCGRFCTDPMNPCIAGFFDCALGSAQCSAAFNVAAGATCGDARTCDGSGHCVSAPTAADGGVGDAAVAVDAAADATFTAPDASGSGDAAVVGCGTFCTDSTDACVAGFYDCSSGAAVCRATLNIGVGTSCGVERECDGMGHCVATSGIVVTPTSLTTVREESGEDVVFTVNLPGVPSSSFTLAVTSSSPSTCQVASSAASIPIAYRDIGSSWSVPVTIRNDSVVTGTRRCVIRFSTPDGDIERSIRVLDTDYVWLSKTDAAQGEVDVFNVVADANLDHVLFASSAAYVREDGNGTVDIYMWTRASSSLTLVSAEPGGGRSGDERSERPFITMIGSTPYVLFRSTASTLVSSDPNRNDMDLFVATLTATPVITRVSLGAYPSEDPPELREIAVARSAPVVLLSGYQRDREEGYAATQVWTYDITTRTYELQSRTVLGGIGNDESFVVGISDDARYVAFSSHATNLIPDDAFLPLAPPHLIYVRDRMTGQLSVVDYGPPEDGDEEARFILNNAVRPGEFAGNGLFVYATTSPFDANDENGVSDIYSFTPFGPLAGVRATFSGYADFESPFGARRHTLAPRVFGGGAFLTFTSLDPTIRGVHTLAPRTGFESFAVETSTGQVRRFGRAITDERFLGDGVVNVSADGRFVAYAGMRDGIVSSDENSSGDVFLTGGF